MKCKTASQFCPGPGLETERIRSSSGGCLIPSSIKRRPGADQDMSQPMKSGLKIYFCTTCKNRFWQLAHTMPQNLAAIELDGFSEMVLVNYNSQDGLDQWIRQFRSAIEAGMLRYVHEWSDPNFHASKAKNLFHFAATGEFAIIRGRRSCG